MIVYSTKLKVTDKLQPQGFIQTLLEWRQHVDYQAFSEALTWDGVDMRALWQLCLNRHRMTQDDGKKRLYSTQQNAQFVYYNIKILMNRCRKLIAIFGLHL